MYCLIDREELIQGKSNDGHAMTALQKFATRNRQDGDMGQWLEAAVKITDLGTRTIRASFCE